MKQEMATSRREEHARCRPPSLLPTPPTQLTTLADDELRLVLGFCGLPALECALSAARRLRSLVPGVLCSRRWLTADDNATDLSLQMWAHQSYSRRVWSGHAALTNVVSVCVDGAGNSLRCASAGQDQTVRLWDAANDAACRRLEFSPPMLYSDGSNAHPLCVALHGDCTAVGDDVGAVNLYRPGARHWIEPGLPGEGQVLADDTGNGLGNGWKRLGWKRPRITTICFAGDPSASTDGWLLGGGDDCQVRVWDVERAGQPFSKSERTVRSSKRPIRALATDGRELVASGGTDGVTLMRRPWERSSGSAAPSASDSSATPLRGSEGHLCGVAVGGDRVGVLYADGSLEVWDAAVARRTLRGDRFGFNPKGLRQVDTACTLTSGSAKLTWDGGHFYGRSTRPRRPSRSCRLTLRSWPTGRSGAISASGTSAAVWTALLRCRASRQPWRCLEARSGTRHQRLRSPPTPSSVMVANGPSERSSPPYWARRTRRGWSPSRRREASSRAATKLGRSACGAYRIPSRKSGSSLCL